MVSDAHRTMVKSGEGTDGKNPSASDAWIGTFAVDYMPWLSRLKSGQHTRLPRDPASYPMTSGFPPGTVGLFRTRRANQRIIDLVQNLIPIALIGIGGIGKASIALTVPHHERIRQPPGDYRWAIRCD